MQATDILAKLLANENITVIRDKSTTASFDIVNRMLRLPQWKDMTLDTEEMLILHETGHALFTGQEYVSAQKDKHRTFGFYLNVIEDARIERKMKDRYPGSRKTFLLGYKDLNDRDFFELNGKNVNDFNLIDRINLFYKLGMGCGVKFSQDEIPFISMIDKADTIQDVIDIAEKVYEFSKNELEQERARINDIMHASVDDDDDEGDDVEEPSNDGSEEVVLDDFDEEYETEDSERHFNDANPQQEPIFDDKELESKTQSALHKNLELNSDENTLYKYYDVDFAFKHSDNLIVPYKKVLEEMSIDMSRCDLMSYYMNVGKDFKTENNGIIANMVKEFEMRKSASAWKRARTAKTGQIDVKKLFGYKIKDDLFKQLTIVKDGKKHGMIFLLDWSGSMDLYMENTCKQLINLVMFAKRIGVAFQVFAFSSSYGYVTNGYGTDYSSMTINSQGLGISKNVTLLELFNDSMSERDMLHMSGFLLSKVWYKTNKFGLGGTPLNEALIAMTNYVGEFIKKRSVEKMIFVTLTDGEGGELVDGTNNLIKTSYFDESACKYFPVKNIIKDKITGKQYSITDHSNDQTGVLMQIIKDRYNTTNIGYNLISSNKHTIYVFCRQNNIKTQVYDIRNSISYNKIAVIDMRGFDHYYLINNKSLDVSHGASIDGIDKNSSAHKAARILTKSMNQNKTSRIILNKFVVEVA